MIVRQRATAASGDALTGVNRPRSAELCTRDSRDARFQRERRHEDGAGISCFSGVTYVRPLHLGDNPRRSTQTDQQSTV
jgi:hypothetical protein